MVGHHTGREGVAGRGDQNAGELGEEEVGVCGDGVVELCLAEGKEIGVLLVACRVFWQSIVVLLEPIDLEEVVVSAGWG